jgi:hypothetical protein
VATPKVKDVSVSGRKGRKQFHTCRDHVVVVRDEAPDLDVVAFRFYAEMTLDRVRFPTGHSDEPTTLEMGISADKRRAARANLSSRNRGAAPLRDKEKRAAGGH